MKQGYFRLSAKRCLSENGRLWQMMFEAPGLRAEPGQFVNISVEGKYLRRPISVSEYDGRILTLVVQEIGEGTRRLIKTPEGECLDMLTGLGNTFSVPDLPAGAPVALIGGGAGFAPLVGLLRKLSRKTQLSPFAIFGFNGMADAPIGMMDGLRKEGFDVEYCTMNGDGPHVGNAVEVARKIFRDRGLEPQFFYTCGPMPMMAAVCREFSCDGELSLEARMGCGFGACMGCTVMTVDGPRRICKEGPVFRKGVVRSE